MKFKSTQLHLDIDTTTGFINRVYKGETEAVGIKKGMIARKINGMPFTLDRLKHAIANKSRCLNGPGKGDPDSPYAKIPCKDLDKNTCESEEVKTKRCTP